MKLKIEPNGNDKAKVSCGRTTLVCEYAKTSPPGHIKANHLQLGYKNATMMNIDVGDEQITKKAVNAVRRAIQYDETWETEV